MTAGPSPSFTTRHRLPAARPTWVGAPPSMTDTGSAPQLDLIEVADERYIQRERAQVAAILRRLADRSQRVWASFGANSEVFEASIAGISTDERTVYVPCSPDEDVNRQLEAAGPLTCLSQLDGVTVQFGLVLERQVARANVFASPLPAALVRLQRRDFFRLVTTTDDEVTCVVPVPEPTGALPSSRRMVVPVADISGGGVALVLPSSGLDVTAGVMLPGCVVVLPEVGSIEVMLRVRNAVRVVDDAGVPRSRVGCEFVHLRDAQLASVQRFIRQVTVRRRERAR